MHIVVVQGAFVLSK